MVKQAIERLSPDYTFPELVNELSGATLHHDETGLVHTGTIHGAKGLEWDHVFLPAFEEGIIPSGSKSANIEEERRLAFVGITRARLSVTISGVRTRAPQFGGNRPEPASPSRFIDEILKPIRE
jgi:superfamily I DNA/RNA helicase